MQGQRTYTVNADGSISNELFFDNTGAALDPTTVLKVPCQACACAGTPDKPPVPVVPPPPTTPGSKELLSAASWTSPADAFSVTVLCLTGSATIVTPDGTGLTMAEGETLSWSRSDQVQTIGQITATAGADSLVHVTWHI
jgi:hypothetical protein